MESHMPMPSVVVTYCAQDRAYGDALVAALRRAGADVWHSPHGPESGEGSEPVREMFDKATADGQIGHRHAFVAVLSEPALGSARVRYQCDLAAAHRRYDPSRVTVPVVAAEVVSGDLGGLG